MQRNPELATSLGLDHGKLAPLKSRLSDVSLAASAQDRRDNLAHLRALQAIDRGKLTGIDISSYDTVLFTLQVMVDGNKAFDYAGGDLNSPYEISQLSGAYHDVPDFLDTQHSIENAADAEAYLARLAALPTMMEQELEQVRHDAALGVVPRISSSTRPCCRWKHPAYAGGAGGAGDIAGAAREGGRAEGRVRPARKCPLHHQGAAGPGAAGRSFQDGAQDRGTHRGRFAAAGTARNIIAWR